MPAAKAINNSSTAIVVFSHYNQRAVLAFLRTLTKNAIQKYAIIANNEQDAIFDSEYAGRVIYTRKHKELDWDEISTAIRNAKRTLEVEQCMIAPSTEALNRYLLDRLGELKRLGCVLPLVDKALYERISDKEGFGELCRSHGLGVPPEVELPVSFTEPMVAKPKRYFAPGTGSIYAPVLLQNAADFDQFIKTFDRNDFYYQKFLHGQSYYLLYYFYRGERLLKLSQENWAQQPNGKSILAAQTSLLHEDHISLQYEQLFRSVGFWGLVMVEVRKSGGQWYMIEANPRFWGPSQLFVDAECNLFEALLSDFGLLPQLQNAMSPKSARYYWGGGFRQTETAGKVPTYYGGYQARLKEEEASWEAADIYDRSDTKRLFLKGE